MYRIYVCKRRKCLVDPKSKAHVEPNKTLEPKFMSDGSKMLITKLLLMARSL